jgi:hypothetical protein
MNLVINNGCHLHELISLLSFRRLSLHNLYGILIESYPIRLNSLTHISIYKTNMTFDEFQFLIENYFQQIQVLHFSRNFDEKFLKCKSMETINCIPYATITYL